MSETGSEMPGERFGRGLKRAPFRAWLVSGPAGRLVGFILDFAKALKGHRASKRV